MPGYTYPDPGEYRLGTKFVTEPWRQGILEAEEKNLIEEQTFHTIQYNNQIFNVKETINSRNFTELPVLQYEQMFICGCEDEKIFQDVHNH